MIKKYTLMIVLCGLLWACSIDQSQPKPSQQPPIQLPLPVLQVTPIQQAIVPSPERVISDDVSTILALQGKAIPRNPVNLALAWGKIKQPLPLREPIDPQVGETSSFWAINVVDSTPFQLQATLEVRTPHLALYVAQDSSFDLIQLQQAATQWEKATWPVLAEWYPQVIMREPITVLCGVIPGVGGYYSADNELPKSINRFSNERSMIFINTSGIDLGGEQFLSTITHEMQHYLHQQVLRDSATWFNEGASMLSEYVTGYGDDSIAEVYLDNPDTQLNAWADSPNMALRYYGGAELWMRYMYDQLQTQLNLGELAAADAGDDLTQWQYVIEQRFPDLNHIDDMYAVWATANVLDDPSIDDGRYAYASLPRTIQPDAAELADSATVAQFGADYLQWDAVDYPRTIGWSGDDEIALISAFTRPDDLLWWSGRGDNRVSTLTAAIRVPNTGARLNYESWFDIEINYDYAYLTVSTDNGVSWTSVRTATSTSDDAVGLNLGQGWSGRGDDWSADSISLNDWNGQSILVRFWMITDDAYNAQGLALKNLRLEPEQPLEWQAQGWQQITNRIPQDWELRLILDDTSVSTVDLIDSAAQITIPARTSAILVITATSPETTQRASYEYAETE